MAVLNWVGGTSTDSTVVANWVDESTGSAPSSIAASDTLSFGAAGALADCVLNQTTVGILIVGSVWNDEGDRVLSFNKPALTINHMKLADNTRIKFVKSATTITFSGTHDDAGDHNGFPVIFEGDVVYETSGNARTTVDFVLQNGHGTPAHLTTGNLPNITLKNSWTWDSPESSVTQGYGKCEIPKLIIFSNCTFTNSNISATTTQKHIQVTGEGVSSGLHLQCAAQTLDFSNAKLTIDAKNAHPLPCTNDTTNFGSSGIFRSLLEDFVVGNANGNGNKVVVPEGLTLECASLEIQSGSQIFGGGTNRQTSAKSHIHCIERPKIRGTWNFEETSDGIYSSAFGVSALSVYTAKLHDATILASLTIEGLIATPEGLEFTPVSSNPGGTAANTLWLNSGDSNKLYHGSSEVGGGGSGDITGVTIQTDSGSSSKATDTGGSADFSLLGANGVGITNSGATITAVAVPAEIDHDALSNFVAAEHVDWAGASAGTIHASNYTDTTTNTQLSNAEVRAAVEAASDSNVFTDADHSKLNAVEASATADQSNAEIRAAVEAATDSNVFTDADHSKLNAIEASATADQTDAEIRTAVEAASDSNVFTDADHSKLNAIEASADVTDTANVVAALTAGTNITIASDGTIAASGGGGGSGDITAVNTNAPITGGATSGAVTLSLSASSASAAGSMSAAHYSKLQAIEAAADVTDATNVSNAGAVMQGQAGADPYNPAAPPNWVGAPPGDLVTAIQRLAAQVAALGGPIP